MKNILISLIISMSVCFVTVGLINPVIGQDNPPLGLTATPGDGVIDLMWYPPFDLNSFDLTGEWNLNMDYYCDGVTDGGGTVNFYSDGTSDFGAVWYSELGDVTLTDGVCPGQTFSYNCYFIMEGYGTVHYMMMENDNGISASDSEGDGTNDGILTLSAGGTGTSGCEGYCEGSAPDGCWCDSLCESYGDCCSDACEFCGYDCGGRSQEQQALYDKYHDEYGNRIPVEEFGYFASPATIALAIQSNLQPENYSRKILTPEQDAGNTITRSVDSYNVYRDGSQYATGLSDLSYSDTDVVNDTLYCYTVTAVTEGVESEVSNEACANSGFMVGQVVINEYSASNLTGYIDNYQKAEDWIEIYNSGNQNINLGGYYLSDDITNPTKWVIPPITIIYGNSYRTFWCSGRDESFFSDIHTNFKLQQTKDTPERIVFSDPEGNIINEIEIQKTQLEHSRGRSPDGSTTWKIFTNPTRGDANTGSSYFAYAGTPAMSIDAGFYNGTQILDISTTEPNSEIHYTLNGNVPYSGSTEYSGSLSISNTKVVKAIVISDDTNILPSFITFNTYFIDESHSLPVLSTSANQLLTLLNGSQSLKPHGTIEYFDGDGIRKDFGYGEYNKHGQDSWAFPQRSFDYIARDEMGYHDAIHEKLLSLSDREDFQRIIIRASGDDNYPGIDSSAHMRDIFIQKLANKNKLNVDMRRGERCVVYANGQFWGIYSIREKVSDADYTNYYYGQDKYNTQYLMNWGITWAQYGGEQAFIDWDEIHSFALNNDLSIQANYEHVADEIDVTSLVDYVLINSFVVCTDWINWNTSWWRGLDPDGSHQKWGYVLWDEDATFNHYINYTNIPNEHADAEPCYPEDIYLDPEQHIVLLNNLLENDEFMQYYISRYMDLLNTAFIEEDMIEILEGIENSIIPDMPQHIDRWGGNMAQWRGNVQKIKTFISDRIDYLPEGLNACYNLTGPYDVTLGVEPANGGQIKFNSLTIANEEYPWTGSYHGGTNMLMEAVQNSTPFNHWELINHTLPNPNLINTSLMLTQGDNITAIFTTDETSYIVINEINYNSSVDFDPEDWVELYNLTDDIIDIGNWIFKDENDDHVFTIPDNTSLASDQYVVLCKDGAAFSALFPEANNFVGDLGFGLAGGGELIRLFDSNGILMDIVEYDDSAPWPVEPDGNGPTLELINSSSDNAIGGNWAASAGFGSPGILNTVSGGQENFVINYSENWNLVGLPAIPSDPNYLSLFPDAVEGTLYYYEQSYMNGSDLTSGRGYWLRFNTAGTADITGTPINEISISLLEGWNLISGISAPLSVNNIDDPNGVIISGTFYSFNDGYVQIQELLPGEGYWMRTTEDGVITLSSGSRAKESVQDIRIDDEANTLVINGSKLYFGIELSETEKLQYSLPPVPPDGAFDARFKGDWSIVNDYGEIKIMNPNEMLTVDYKLRNPAEEDGVWVLTSESGAEYLLNSDGEFEVPSEERFTLEKRTDIPMEFALSQNYPNPFNPVTTIKIAIEKYSRVSLEIFDITGRMVTTLIEKELDTGYHNVYWSGKDKIGRSVSSGIYLYRMTARPKDEGKDGGFTRTKKMVLLK